MEISTELQLDYILKILRTYISYLIRFLFLLMITISLGNSYSSIDTIFAFNIFFLLPNRIQNALLTWGQFRQDLYNKANLLIFNSTYRFPIYILKQIHCLLFYFRYFCLKINNYNPSMFTAYLLFFALICSRFHVAGYFIIGALLFIRIEFAVLSMLRFYQKYPTVLQKNFPGVLTHKRGMWSQAGKIASEAAMNPKVQAVGAAVLGAVAWKALDIHDTYVQKDIAEADRTAETARHGQTLKAEDDRHAQALKAEAESRKDENDRHTESLKVESDRHTESLKAEAVQRELDRHAESLKAEAVEREKDRQSALEIAKLSSRNDSE